MRDYVCLIHCVVVYTRDPLVVKSRIFSSYAKACFYRDELLKRDASLRIDIFTHQVY